MAILNVTQETFETEVLEATKTVLVDFWAEACAPCRMLNPILENVAAEVGESVKICKINVDEQPQLADRFAVISIPTLAVFRNGRMVRSVVGVRPKNVVLKLIG